MTLDKIVNGFNKTSKIVDNLSAKAAKVKPYIITAASAAAGSVSAKWAYNALEKIVGFYVPEATAALLAGATVTGAVAVAENQGLSHKYRNIWNKFKNADHSFFNASKYIDNKLHFDLYDKWDMIKDVCGNKFSRTAPAILSIGAMASMYGPEHWATWAAAAFGLYAAKGAWQGEKSPYQRIKFGNKFKEYFSRKNSIGAVAMALLSLGISAHSTLDYKPKHEPIKIAAPAASSPKPYNAPTQTKIEPKYEKPSPKYDPGKSNLVKAIEKEKTKTTQYQPVVNGGVITSKRGYRKDPITGKWRYHQGVDIAAPAYTPIRPINYGCGQVISTGKLKNYEDFGKIVAVDHGNGIISYYAHIDDIKVNLGDKVCKDTVLAVIADMRKMGRGTGPHVHVEVSKNGKSVDPMGYVR
jgi:murein DD-endopeptidase MepM/ murein hydrolase activator NlpD